LDDARRFLVLLASPPAADVPPRERPRHFGLPKCMSGSRPFAKGREALYRKDYSYCEPRQNANANPKKQTLYSIYFYEILSQEKGDYNGKNE
jgi:hypothetical protein